MPNPLAVVLDAGVQPARWPAPQPNFSGYYMEEILRHAGLFFDVLRKGECRNA